MSFRIGLDLGGTKIAGLVMDQNGEILAEEKIPTPSDNYDQLLKSFAQIVAALEQKSGRAAIGVGMPWYAMPQAETESGGNIPCVRGHNIQTDLEKILAREIRIANDADSFALAEACDGAARDGHIVFGAILGTGVGGGLIIDRKPISGPHRITGEWGHVPLPWREESDGPIQTCWCGNKGCIEFTLSGPALAKLFEFMTGLKGDSKHIAEQIMADATHGPKVLEQYYVTAAKAFAMLINMLDPDVIVIGGGLRILPDLPEGIMKYLPRHALVKKLRTKIVSSRYGGDAGMRGAAWLWSAEEAADFSK